MRLTSCIAVATAFAALASDAAAQCPHGDRVERKLSLSGGQSQALMTQRIPVCVRHEYRIALRAGQRLEIRLTSPSGQRSMLTLVAPSGERPVDGGMEWSGAVAESGTYRVEVGTDVTTSYTLTLSVR